MAQIRGVEQSLRGARCTVPPPVTIPLLKIDGRHDSDHVSVNPNFEWKSEVNSFKRVWYPCHHAFILAHRNLSSPNSLMTCSFLNWLTIVSSRTFEFSMYAHV
jgi:hypothetical protein